MSSRRNILIAAACAALLANSVRPAWSADAEKSRAKPPALGSMIIVAPSAFHEELRPFVEHKRQSLSVELESLESILAQTQGADDPEKLKRFLYRHWREQMARYVLLVGDADVLPVRYMVLDRITPAAYDYAFYPSDLYYADVAKQDSSFEDWNASKEGFHGRYYGEVRGEKNKSDPINFDHIDYLPELAVGRWPVSTPQEVRTLVAKSVAFEKSVRSGQRNPPRVGLVSTAGWVDVRGRLDRMAASMPSGWKIEKRYYADSQKNPGTPPPNEKEVVALLNSGVDLVVHTGHGTDKSWQGCFSLKHLGQVHNADRLSVMLSAGCSTARFATLPPYEPYVDVDGVEHRGSDAGEVFAAPAAGAVSRGRFNPPGLGEQLLRAGPNGAVAYFGCNTGSQPCGVTLVEGLLADWARSPAPRLGDCWVAAVRFYYEKEHLATLRPTPDWYPPSIFFQGMKFMLFGDPTLCLPQAKIGAS